MSHNTTVFPNNEDYNKLKEKYDKEIERLEKKIKEDKGDTK